MVADVTVDQGFGLAQMTTLGSRLRHLDPAHVTFATLPVLSSAAVRVVHGLRVDIVLLDPARTAQLFAGLHDGTAHPAPGTGAAAGPPLTVAPAAISLEVRNGASTAELAGRVARSLRGHGHGYTVTAIGTASPVDQTTVRYRPGMLAAARTVAAALPGAQLQADPTLTVGVQLVLGPDSPAVVAVHLASSATPSGRAGRPAAATSPRLPSASPAVACAP